MATIFVRRSGATATQGSSANVARGGTRPSPGYVGARAELLLDPEQLVVLRDAVAARRRAGLDLAGAERDGEIGDRRVLGLAGAMRHHRGVAVRLREPHGLDRLRQRADLVDLHEDRVGDAAVDPLAQPLGIRHEEVVADELHALAELARQRRPASQSSSAQPSSIETIGYASTRPRQKPGSSAEERSRPSKR